MKFFKNDSFGFWIDEDIITYDNLMIELRNVNKLGDIFKYFHRTDGPAVILYIEDITWHEAYILFGIPYSKEEYDEAIKILKEEGEVAFKLRFSGLNNNIAATFA